MGKKRCGYAPDTDWMILIVVHGAASCDHVALFGNNLVRDGKEHLRQSRRSTTDLGPGLLAALLVFSNKIAAVHNAELVSVRAVGERMNDSFLFQFACSLESFFSLHKIDFFSNQLILISSWFFFLIFYLSNWLERSRWWPSNTRRLVYRVFKLF